jgi:hypothetical protein
VLKGSLHTVALPEVLNFLSSTGKTGELHLTGGDGEGRLWFGEGRISGFDVKGSEEAFEAVFELLRIGEGEFNFSSDAERPEGVAVVDGDGEVAPVVEAAEKRLQEWSEIVAVVPSLEHRVSLRPDAPSEHVSLTGGQWELIVAIGTGRSVGEVIADRNSREFAGCLAVRELVEASLAEIGEPEAAPEVAPFQTAVSELVAEWPVADEPVPAWPVVEEPAAHGFGDYESSTEDSTAVEVGGEEVVDHDHPDVSVWDSHSEEEGEFHDPDAIPGNLLRFGFTSHEGGQEGAAEVADLSSPELSSALSDVLAEVAAEEEGSEDDSHHEQVELTGADRYAALRAAMVEVGEDLVGEQSDVEDGPRAAVYELDTEGEVDGRAALHALLTEVTAPGAEEPIDGLADRGPWTDHELATMDSEGEWSEPEAEQESNIVPFAPVAHAADEPEAVEEPAEEAPASGEPINRGLLLKFLSSVRN